MTYYGEAPTTDGDYKVVRFLQSGEFVRPGNVAEAEALVVAAGGTGGRGTGDDDGGGGAGGYLIGTQALAGTMTVVVGVCPGINSNGGDSSFGTFTAVGGGRGGYYSDHAGNVGGSGGGGVAGAGSAGTAGQGYGGGTGATNAGGGGGGAGGAGTNGASGGHGGVGINCDIVESGVDVGYAGGGAGGTAGATASHGGGVYATAGTPNTGGGGGAQYDTSHLGGSGIVVIRWLEPPPDFPFAAYGTIALSGFASLDRKLIAHCIIETIGHALLGNTLNLRARYGTITLAAERPALGNAYTGDMAAYGAIFTGSDARLSSVGESLPARETGLIRPDIFFRHGFALGIEGLTHRAGILDISIDLSDHGGFIAATIVTATLGGGSAPAMYSDCVIVCGGQTFRGRLESRQKTVSDTAGYTLTYAGMMTKLRDHRGFRRCYVTSDLQGWSTDQGPRSSPDTFEVISRTSGNTA